MFPLTLEPGSSRGRELGTACRTHESTFGELMTEFTLENLKATAAACVDADTASALESSNVDVPIRELGYDSLAFFEIVTRLQDELKISIPDRDIDELHTARAIIEYINGRVAGLAS
jgi:minimal PKS acyl carrier protein